VISAALDAQPPSAAHSAAIPRIRIFDRPLDGHDCSATKRREQAELREKVTDAAARSFPQAGNCQIGPASGR
jgi:hypothetical protein